MPKVLLTFVFCIKCMFAIDVHVVRYDIRNKEVFFNASSVTYLQLEQGILFIDCVLLCTHHVECCTASYKMEGGVCQLNSHCCPQTMAKNDSKLLIRDQTLVQTSIRRDCSDLMPGSCSGIYPIVLLDERVINAKCEMETDGGQWTVIQRRFDGSVSFYRDWEEYKWGFGDINGEFWFGNENIHGILSGNTKSYKLRFDLVDFNDTTAYAEYSEFYVDSEATDYRITISGYSGNAGDSMDDLSYWESTSGMKFSTPDRDNDLYTGSCALFKRAGFWFRKCVRGNVNGVYINKAENHAMHWKTWHGLDGLKETRMMIKPIP